MKHVLSGTALAAVLALAAPAWAQSSTAPNSSNAPSATEAAPGGPQAAPKAHHPRSSRHMRMSHRVNHAMMRRHQGHQFAAQMHHPISRMSAHRIGRGPSDNVAEQLNRQELERMSGSGMPPDNYPNQQPGYAPGGYQGR